MVFFPKRKLLLYIYYNIYIIIKILLEYCGVSEKKLYNCINCFFPVRSRSIMQKKYSIPPTPTPLTSLLPLINLTPIYFLQKFGNLEKIYYLCIRIWHW